jgi:hypothetical protein
LDISFFKTRAFWWYWLPPVAWCGLVLIVSGDLGSSKNSLCILKWLLSWLPLSTAQFNLVNFYIRKSLGHFSNYGLLYFLWFRAFQGQQDFSPGRAFLYSMTCCLGVALMDEGHQAMFVSRSGSLRDLPLDLAGASVAALLTSFFWTRRVRAAMVK